MVFEVIYLQWFKSYLHNIKQFVQIQKTKADINVLACGVPQGSILRPLFYIFYIIFYEVSKTLDQICLQMILIFH